MNITARINARKIVLSYFYEYCFFYNLKNNTHRVEDILFIDNVFKTREDTFNKYKTEILNDLDGYLKQDFEDNIDYYKQQFFDQWPNETIDMEYIFSVGNKIQLYVEEMKIKVDSYVQNFSYSQMDAMDQALFLLGYVEWKELQTPKEILLNELVELSKRYADEGSSKLINGIMHHILVS